MEDPLLARFHERQANTAECGCTYTNQPHDLCMGQTMKLTHDRAYCKEKATASRSDVAVHRARVIGEAIHIDGIVRHLYRLLLERALRVIQQEGDEEADDDKRRAEEPLLVLWAEQTVDGAARNVRKTIGFITVR